MAKGSGKVDFVDYSLGAVHCEMSPKSDTDQFRKDMISKWFLLFRVKCEEEKYKLVSSFRFSKKLLRNWFHCVAFEPFDLKSPKYVNLNYRI
jgi:hypothetical protein